MSDNNYEENDILATALDFSNDEQISLSNLDGLGIAMANDENWYENCISPNNEYLTIDCYFTHADGDIEVD